MSDCMGIGRREFMLGLGAAVGVSLVGGCRSVPVGGAAPGCVVYFGGRIYTADKAKPYATALVVEDGELSYVGTDEGAREYAGEGAKSVDLAGRRVLPGFVDTHVHPVFASAGYGHGTHELDCGLSHAETLDAVRKIAAGDPGGARKPLLFAGYGEKCRPLASELDKLGIDRPIVLLAMDLHSAWVNTKALTQAKVTAKTEDAIPGASFFERDAEGKPTGHVVESAQMVWLLLKLRAYSSGDIRRGYRAFVQMFNAKGFTTVFDAGVGLVADETAFGAVSRAKEPLRFYASVIGPDTGSVPKFVEKLCRMRERFEGPNFHLTTLKLFKDGTFEQGTALTYRPYAKAIGGTGVSMSDNARMLELARACAEEDFNVHVHAIGARAIDETLEMLHALGEIEGTKAIAHIENVDARGLKLFAENKDVFATTTPSWFATGPEYERAMVGVLGDAEAFHGSYPIGTLKRSGTPVVFGSDLPVTSGELPAHDAMLAIDMAVNRGTRVNLLKGRGEALTVAEAIDAYTIDAARMLRGEEEFGSLTEGKSADFVVLDRDILSIDPQEIARANVVETYFRGRCVYVS